MRKLFILLICIALGWGAYYTISEGFNIGSDFSVSSYNDVSSASSGVDTLIGELVNVNDVQFARSKESLETAIKKYKDTKEEYEELVETLNNDGNDQDISLVDTYDIDFLWTTIGNYGTEEGISLKFDVIKSPSSFLDTQSYTMCDLKFTVSGNYIPITDFIYDLEDDSKLEFEISEFSLVKGGDNLQATFTVKNVPINNKNLTQFTTYVAPSTNVDSNGNPVNDAEKTTNSTSTDTSTNTVNS